MREMLVAGVHFGHQKRYCNPKMAPYIFGLRSKIHIINLEKTVTLYQEALNFITKKAEQKSKILFVGTKRASQAIIKLHAERCGMPYVNHRWLGGMLTNYKTIRKSVTRFQELEKIFKDGTIDRFTKKEALLMTRELAKFERSLGGVKNMSGLPDVLFVIDVGHEDIAIQEANRLKIPVVGIVDTNNSPLGIDYLVPGNDDSTAAIDFFVKGVADAILEVKAREPQAAALMTPEMFAEAAPESQAEGILEQPPADLQSKPTDGDASNE
jgi:small subunit ribosomal protein S2